MSLLGTFLRPKSFQTPSTIAAATTTCISTKGRGAGAGRKEYRTQQTSGGDSIGGRRRVRRRLDVRSIEDVFVQSLVAASTCRACSTTASSRRLRTASELECDQHARRRPLTTASRAFSTTRRRHQAETALQVKEEPDDPRQQYQDLLDTYDTTKTRGPPPPKVPPEHFRLAPRLAITPEQEERPPFGKRQVLRPIDKAHKRQLQELNKFLRAKPGYRTEKLWQAYLTLPGPRLRYLTDTQVMKLFRHFSWVETRDFESSQRYFSLLEDALGERVPLGPDQWNTAISYAGRCVRITTADDVKAAIETWLRMEREGGVAANNVTFNILFDIAVKAERFALADTIHAEMARRGLELNRYFRTSMIYYAGKRGDAETVRASFREVVAAGEIVDTAIMNCVILSLVRCGEAASAEQVMAKMKLLHEQKFGTAALEDWRDKKFMGRQLDEFAREFREERNQHLASFFGSPNSNDDKKEEMQRAAPIAPDELTYRILIKWHCNASGNFDKIREYVDAIKEAGSRVRYNVYFQLFNGFVKHGGYAFTAWNRKSLEAYWTEFVETIAQNAAPTASKPASEDKPVEVDAGKDEPVPAAERYEIYPLDPSDALGPDPTQGTTDTTTSSSPLDDNENDDWYINFSSEDEDPDYESSPDPLPSHLAPMEFRPGTVMAALAAFYKCAGAKRMLEVWDEIKEKWPGMGEAERRRIEELVQEKVREAGMYVDYQ